MAPPSHAREIALMPAKPLHSHPVDNPLRKGLVDEAIERYVDWREECAAVKAAYARWLDAAEGKAELPFAAYRAALDREERAAACYRTVIERVGRMFGGANDVAAAA